MMGNTKIDVTGTNLNTATYCTVGRRHRTTDHEAIANPILNGRDTKTGANIEEPKTNWPEFNVKFNQFGTKAKISVYGCLPYSADSLHKTTLEKMNTGIDSSVVATTLELKRNLRCNTGFIRNRLKLEISIKIAIVINHMMT